MNVTSRVDRVVPLVLSLLLLGLSLGLSACATGRIATAPFEQLASSLQQVRTGADASLSAVYDRSRDRYLNEAAAGDIAKVQGLMLTKPPDDPFGWVSSAPPLFLAAARFREGVYRFNSTLIQYAGVLSQLAARDLIDSKTFNQIATDLNGNLISAARAFGVAASGKEVAIFSTAATAAFEAYLRNQQRAALLKALRDNQATVQAVAELGAQAVRITASAVRNEYDQQSAALANTAASAPSPGNRLSSLRDLAELDDRFMKEMSALRTLYDTYVALPDAHRELAAGLEDAKFGVSAIRVIFQNGQDLYRRYEELAKDGKRAK